MDIDQQLKNLIERASFLAFDEKAALLYRISSLDKNLKEKLLNFLITQETQNAALNLKHLAIFQKNYDKWQDIFNKASQLIKR